MEIKEFTMDGFKKVLSFWDDAAVYLFCVVSVLFSDRILHSGPVDFGWQSVGGALIAAVILTGAVELFGNGTAHPEVKRMGKQRNLWKRLAYAGAFGLAAPVYLPMLIKSVLPVAGSTL
jgi:hypothetical protein